MKRVRVRRPDTPLFILITGDNASGNQQIDPNGLLRPAHRKRQEDTTDEFRIERNSCLVLNTSTCVSSVTLIVKQNLIQEQTASLRASWSPLHSLLLVDRSGPTLELLRPSDQTQSQGLEGGSEPVAILLLLIMGLQHPRLKILLPLFRVSPPLSRKMRPYFCVSVLPYLHRLADPPLGFGPEWLERCRTVRLMGIWPQF